MSWICLPDEANCEVKFYSIADDIELLFKNMLGFLINVTPGVYIMLLVIFMFIVAFYILISVRLMMNKKA